jgi:predicted TIM-barrel fold metal-dependent hydrolase
MLVLKIVEGGTFTIPARRAECTVDLLLEDMDRRGVDAALVMGFPDAISNEELSELMKEHPKRIIGFAGVDDPKGVDSVAQLRRAVEELGLRGLKLHPDVHSFSPSDPEMVPLIRCAAELNVPVLIHSFPGGMIRGYFNLSHPGHIDTLKRRVPDATIIVGHMGWPRYMDLLTIGQIPGVYVETSWGLTNIAELNGTTYTAKLLRIIGAENIVFGSDWLGPGIGEEQQRQLRLIENLNLSREEKEGILGENIRKVLAL